MALKRNTIPIKQFIPLSRCPWWSLINFPWTYLFWICRKWNHTNYLLCLISLSSYVFNVHPYCSLYWYIITFYDRIIFYCINILYLICWGITILFCIAAAPFFVPTISGNTCTVPTMYSAFNFASLPKLTLWSYSYIKKNFFPRHPSVCMWSTVQ